MSSHQVLILLLITLFIFVLPSIGLYFMFRKAGEAGWKALIPFFNTWVMMDIAKRPVFWVFLQFVPIVGWFVTLAILIEFVKTFGKFRFYQHALTVCTFGLYFAYVGLNSKDKFIGPEAVRKHKKSSAREWIDAGVFAIVAATIIRTFVFEAYTIPTPSMEKTLLVNDFLFVSKFSYGPRIPNTPLAMPFVHHTLPFVNVRSYVEWIRLPYIRWFPSPVRRNDVVVFNFPAGDTVINREGYQSEVPYYDVIRALGNNDVNAGRQIVLNDPDEYPLIVRPVDKRENYIKRCVAVAGDTLRIKNQVVYINGKETPFPPYSQTTYLVTTAGQALDENVLKEEYNIDLNNSEEIQQTGNPNQFRMLLTASAKERMLKSGLAKSIVPELDTIANGHVFPYDNIHHWSVDSYGPIWIPRKDATLTLTSENYSIYERVIRTYERNQLETRNGKFYINGQETTQYTFKMDYYWMMGDNRHQSQDSRYWGFVPEDHVVGEAWLIWMSWDKGVRWNRLFNRIR
ncbi:MAG: signal peptidase I [Bacteroidetes bacterium]|nr:MAG: signal peptidase I [Bacteroidota bacterium]